MLKFSKTVSFFLALVLTVGAFVGCAGNKEDDGKIRILCSVFPEYDWVRSIVGDAKGVEVSLLVSNGQELHSYEASPTDIVNIKESDLVISVGGASDKWIEEALKGEDAKHIKLSEIEGVRHYDISSQSDERDHEHEHDHTHGEIDEHLWLSLKNARTIVRYLADELALLDEDNAEKYKINSEKYIEKLIELDERMTDIATDDHTLLFADRFPFVYLLEDYGMGYYAAFEGCSSDISWTPKTTVELAERLDATDEKYLFITETSDGELARLVISASANGGEIVTLDSMQSVSRKAAERLSYIDVMTQNIAAIENAFGK